MDCGPPKHCFDWSFFPMNKHSLSGGNLMIHAAVSFQINESLVCDIIYKPADFIHMCFNNYLKLVLRVDDTHCRAVRVCKNIVDKWADIINPKSLACLLYTSPSPRDS